MDDVDISESNVVIQCKLCFIMTLAQRFSLDLFDNYDEMSAFYIPPTKYRTIT